MTLKPEQVKEIQDAVSEALNDMLPRFAGDDPISKLTSAMEASIGHVYFYDGRTAAISIRVEIETKLEQLSDALLSSDEDYWKCDNCGAINRVDKHDTVCPYCEVRR